MKRSKITILGIEYKITYRKKLDCAGRCNFAKYTIELDHGLLKFPRAHEAVLYHEISHAFQHECGLYEFLEPQAQEMLAQNLQAFIIQLLNGALK